MRVVISQSMFFPWVGLLEQIRLADVFVHYDDVQFSKGSFVNRVQLKTVGGLRWLTVPLQNHRLGQRIDAVELAPASGWEATHLALLQQSLGGAPHADDAFNIVKEVYGQGHADLASLARASMLAVAEYFDLARTTRFVDVGSLGIEGASSDRVLSIVRHLGGTRYVTGHGAARYLDHEAFERSNVQVEYMNYRCLPYAQLHGPFTPYVSSLDLVACRGRAGASNICSDTITWKEFLHESP